MNEGIGGDHRWNLIALLGHGVRFRFFFFFSTKIWSGSHSLDYFYDLHLLKKSNHIFSLGTQVFPNHIRSVLWDNTETAGSWKAETTIRFSFFTFYRKLLKMKVHRQLQFPQGPRWDGVMVQTWSILSRRHSNFSPMFPHPVMTRVRTPTVTQRESQWQ